jgi:hypothetical protein
MARTKSHPAMFLSGITHTLELPALFDLLTRESHAWMTAVTTDSLEWNGNLTYYAALNAAVLGQWHAPKIKTLTLPELTGTAEEMRYFNDFIGNQLDVTAYCSGEPEYWQNAEPIQKACGRVIRLAVEIGGLSDVDALKLRNRGEAIIALINSLELQGHSIELTIVRAYSNIEGKNYRFLIPVKHAGQSIDVRRLQFIIGHPAFFRRCLFGLTELAQGKNLNQCKTHTESYAPDGYIHIGHKQGLATSLDAAMEWAQQFAHDIAAESQN